MEEVPERKREHQTKQPAEAKDSFVEASNPSRFFFRPLWHFDREFVTTRDPSEPRIFSKAKRSVPSADFLGSCAIRG